MTPEESKENEDSSHKQSVMTTYSSNNKVEDKLLQDLLRQFELPIYNTEPNNKIEITTPEDKVDNIEVYKKLIQKYKGQDNNNS